MTFRSVRRPLIFFMMINYACYYSKVSISTTVELAIHQLVSLSAASSAKGNPFPPSPLPLPSPTTPLVCHERIVALRSWSGRKQSLYKRGECGILGAVHPQRLQQPQQPSIAAMRIYVSQPGEVGKEIEQVR